MIYAGELAAAVGLKFTSTGDTLCAQDKPDRARVDGLPRAGHRGRHRAQDEGRRGEALRRRCSGSPKRTRRSASHSDEETGQTIIAGMGELHLEIIVDRLLREFKVDANVGRPQVAYRETVRAPCRKVEGRFVRQTGGRGQYGHVVIDLEPNEPGEGYVFENQIVGRRHPARLHPGGRPGHPGGHEHRRTGRLPHGRRQGRADRRLLPRGRLVRARLQDRRLAGASRTPPRRPSRCCSSR